MQPESLVSMKMIRQIPSVLLGAALAFTPALSWSQQSTPDTTAGQDTRSAGHETKDAAKDAGSGVKKGTKHAYHSTKRGTKKAWHKTKNTTKGAVNGGKEGAQQPTNPQ